MYIKEFIYAFLCTVGFSVLFNIPRRLMVYSGFCGAIGWIVYSLVSNNLNSLITATFLGALVVGISGEIFARRLKKPATVFVIPGIIPLVPGYGLYYSMLKIIEKNYEEAISVGFEAILVAIAIASAVIIATSVGRIMREVGLKSRI